MQPASGLSDLTATAALADDGTSVITIQNDQGGSIVVNTGANGSLDQISFADGSSASLSDLLAQATTGVTATTSAVDVTLADGIQNMILTGTGNLTATGNALDDVITANSGNDTLIAGTGNDTLVGGGGTTTYEFDAGDADIVINNSGSNDTLVFGAGIAESDLTTSSAVVNGVTVVTITDSQGGSVTIQGGSLEPGRFRQRDYDAQPVARAFVHRGTALYSTVSTTAPDSIVALDLTGSADITGPPTA